MSLLVQLWVVASSKLMVSNVRSPSSQLFKAKTQANKPKNRFIFILFSTKIEFLICSKSILIQKHII